MHINIIGAGPIGLLTALALRGHDDISINILERSSELELKKRCDRGRPSRLYAISSGSMSVMHDDLGLGLDGTDFQPIKRIFINDGAANTTFNPVDINQQNFGYMIEESDLFSQLLIRVEQESKINLRYNSLINIDNNLSESEGAVNLSLNSEYVDADLIIAADGRNSSFRRDLPFEFKHHDYDELALVFAIHHPDFAHNGLAVETFLPSGPFAILPHKSPNHSSVVWSADTKLIKQFLELDVDEQYAVIRSKILDRYQGFSFSSKFITYPLALTVLDNLYYKNVLLLGDSSHVIHPIAGQGINLGIRDVRDFAVMMQDRHMYSDLNSMLRKYEAGRKQDIKKLSASTDLLSNLFSNNNMALKSLRKLGLSIFDNIPSAKRRAMSYASNGDKR